MCHFINATLPRSADVDAVRAIAATFDRAWTPILTGRVVARLRPGETYYNTTARTCDCGTVLGNAAGVDLGALDNTGEPAPPDLTEPDWQNRRVRKLLKKGWSKAKIRRSLADQDRVAARSVAAQIEGMKDDVPHAEPWLRFLNTVVSSGAAPGIGLMLVWGKYEGGDRLQRESVRLSEIGPEFLLAIEQDRLYDFQA